MWKSTEAWKVLDLVGRAPLRESFQVVMIKKTFQKGKGVVTCGVFLKNNNHGNFGTTVFFKKT